MSRVGQKVAPYFIDILKLLKNFSFFLNLVFLHSIFQSDIESFLFLSLFFYFTLLLTFFLTFFLFLFYVGSFINNLFFFLFFPFTYFSLLQFERLYTIFVLKKITSPVEIWDPFRSMRARTPLEVGGACPILM